MKRILIIEDEAVIRDALVRLLERRGFSPKGVDSVEQARSRGVLDACDLVIADLRLPGAPGTEVLRLAPGLPVLIMTSYASVRSAVEAMKQGAVDYIAKPFDHDELVLQVERILRERARQRRERQLAEESSRTWPVDGMVGDCPAMQSVGEAIRRVAPTDSTVLILGESGTGKELVARALHAHSRRNDGPFVAVNCASIPEGLIESELFGHEKGAFTGADRSRTGLVESADGGTLFLDEVGDLPAAVQVRLLRMLQEREVQRLGANRPRAVDVRILAATNRDLKAEVQTGRFRSDLYFRLRVVEIVLPPLRERGEDILSLARFLLKKVCRRLDRPLVSLGPAAEAAIRAYSWPGNVRELENALERAVILGDDGPLCADLLSLGEVRRRPGPEVEWSLEEYFRQFVLAHEDEMTETELAQRLGISRKALWERRRRFNLPRK